MDNSDKGKRIKKEITRLEKVLGKGDPKIEASKRLIENAAFMAVGLEDLQAEILEVGWTEVYKNGEHQTGKKKSAAADAYMTMYKNYLATVKQLAEIAPDGAETDALNLFNQ